MLVASGKTGEGKAGEGEGDGETGTTGYAMTTGQAMNVMGNESFIARSESSSKDSSKLGSGKGKPDPHGAVVVDKAEVPKGLTPVNRKSGAVAAESVIEEYSDVVEHSFKAITK